MNLDIQEDLKTPLTGSKRMRSLRLLHADPSATRHDIVRTAVGNGVRIDHAPSGGSALALLRERNVFQRHHLILLSWDLGDVSALDVLSTAKRDKLLRPTPVVVLAIPALSDAEIYKAYDAGAACVLAGIPDAATLRLALRHTFAMWFDVGEVPVWDGRLSE